MIRRLNFTGRIKIRQKHILLSYEEDPVEGPILKAVLKLGSYRDRLPGDAKVYVEAYRATRFQRFDFGVLSHPRPQGDRRLTAFSSGELPSLHFRLKIVDESRGTHGRLLAVAKGIPFVSADRLEGQRRSLLGFDVDDLGDRVWRLDLTPEEAPYLVLNERLQNPQDTARWDDAFLSLVYPAVVEEILHHILIDDAKTDWESSEDPEEDNWRHLWVVWAKDVRGDGQRVPSRRRIEDRARWVEETVSAFCELETSLRRYTKGMRVSQ